jgi:hypothetical protein
MAKKADRETSSSTERTKAQLQRQMARTRESLAETVGEIKETVEQQVDMVSQGVSSVLNFREEFQNDPLVWSLGALSAGFALGYTVGYAHKNTKGRKQNEITAFANTMIEQLSTMGKGLVLPALDAKISELFGFQFSSILEQIRSSGVPAKKNTRSRAASGRSKTGSRSVQKPRSRKGSVSSRSKSAK